jgi:hypothetical protein
MRLPDGTRSIAGLIGGSAVLAQFWRGTEAKEKANIRVQILHAHSRNLIKLRNFPSSRRDAEAMGRDAHGGYLAHTHGSDKPGWKCAGMIKRREGDAGGCLG